MYQNKKFIKTSFLIVGLLITIISLFYVNHRYIIDQTEKCRNIVLNSSLVLQNHLENLSQKTIVMDSMVTIHDGEITREDFDKLAHSLYKENSGIRALQLLPNGVIEYCYPLEGNEKAIGKDIFKLHNQLGDVLLAKETKQIICSGPYILAQGGKGLIIRNPIFLENENNEDYFWGYSCIVLDLPDSLENVNYNQLVKDGYYYQLSCVNDWGENMIVSSSGEFDISKGFSKTIIITNKEWTLTVMPIKGWIDYYHLSLIALVGILFTLLITYSYSYLLLDISNRTKDVFLASVSHEIRTPMNAILGFSELGLQEQENTNNNKYFKLIKSNTFYLENIINNFLDMQKKNEENIFLTKEINTLENLQNKILERITSYDFNKNINFTYKFDSENSPHNILVDGKHYIQAITNILSNSFKFTQNKGNINWKVETYLVEKDLLLVVNKISDDGIGMSKDFVKEMYKPFTRETKQQSTNLSGTGIGLTVTKKIIELNHGLMSCDTEKNKGTNFTLSFYLNIPFSSKSMEKTLLLEKIDSNEMLLNKKILICEDVKINALIVTKILERKGIIVDIAENGKIGVEKAKQFSFDAILMDIRMPIMDGILATHEIRKFNKTIPIIALSANAYSEDVQKSIKAGMNEHLCKPIDKERLYSTLIKLIKENNSIKKVQYF